MSFWNYLKYQIRHHIMTLFILLSIFDKKTVFLTLFNVILCQFCKIQKTYLTLKLFFIYHKNKSSNNVLKH